ncbi:ATPase family AAA domain-containing protein At1g05910-like isoform X1 [Corylus avellana]|nr:ATPase family AAA domain-containing protein At1g05910-like isoform X1 [Corylus avellana]
MLSQMDPALVAYCDKIAAQGGPVHTLDDLGGSTFPSTPVVQLGTTTTRASARLRNVQPEVNLDQSYEALKRPKKNADAAHAGSIAEDKSRYQDSVVAKSSQEQETNDTNPERPETSCGDGDGDRPETCGEPSGHADGSGPEDVTMCDIDISGQTESVRRLFVERTATYNIPQLERLYTRIMKGVFETKDKVKDDLRPSILTYLEKFAEDEANF